MENKETLVLKGIESANQIIELALNSLRNETEFNYELVISDDIENIEIKVYGDKFHDSITGQFARGIWEFQQEIYRAIAFTIHGVASIRKLSKEELDQYNITFYVKDGCTEIKGVVKPILKFLNKNMENLPPTTKAILIGTIFAILTTGFVVWRMNAQDTEVEIARTNQKTIEAVTKEHTKQLELMKDVKTFFPTVQRWEEAAESGAKAMIKSLDDGDSMDYGETHVSSDQVKTIKQKSPRSQPDEDTISGKFELYGFKDITDNKISIEIRNASGEFTVTMEAEDFSPEEFLYIKHKAADNAMIEMTIKKVTVRDRTKEIYVSDFTRNPDDPIESEDAD